MSTTIDPSPIRYEKDVIDEIILSMRGYIVAFDQFLDVYDRNRRLYALESHQQAVEEYPQIFAEPYASILIFKRKFETAMDKYRMEPVDQHLHYEKKGVGNVRGEGLQFEGVR